MKASRCVVGVVSEQKNTKKKKEKKGKEKKCQRKKTMAICSFTTVRLFVF